MLSVWGFRGMVINDSYRSSVMTGDKRLTRLFPGELSTIRPKPVSCGDILRSNSS